MSQADWPHTDLSCLVFPGVLAGFTVMALLA